MEDLKIRRRYRARENHIFTAKDMEEMRNEFLVLFKKEPKSYRRYSREVGIGVSGRVLRDFLCATRITTVCSLIKIRNYLDSRKSS